MEPSANPSSPLNPVLPPEQPQVEAPVVSNIEPEPQITSKPKKKHHHFRLFIIALIVALIAIPALYLATSWIISDHNTPTKSTATSNKVSLSGGTVIPKLDAAEQARINAGLPPNASSTSLAVVNVTVPYGGDADHLPLVSSGHYIYHQTTNADGGSYLGTIIYDGKTVFSDPNTTYDSSGSDSELLIEGGESDLGLSPNGLHYGYVLTQNNNYQIYIDNKLVRTVNNKNDNNNDLNFVGISNDGTHYIFEYDDPSISNALVVEDQNGNVLKGNIGNGEIYDQNFNNHISENGKTDNQYEYDYNILTAPYSIGGVGISSGGNNYFATDYNSLGGENITSSKINPKYAYWNYECGGSNPIGGGGSGYCGPYSGAQQYHYFLNGYDTYIDCSQFLLNDKVVYETPTVKTISKFSGANSDTKSSVPLAKITSDSPTLYGTDNYGGIDCPGVNNSGDYYFVQDIKSLDFIIDGKYVYPLNRSDFTFDKYSYCAVNDSNSHYVIFSPDGGQGGYGYLDVDGKLTNPTSFIQSVQLEGSTLYVYKHSDS